MLPNLKNHSHLLRKIHIVSKSRIKTNNHNFLFNGNRKRKQLLDANIPTDLIIQRECVKYAITNIGIMGIWLLSVSMPIAPCMLKECADSVIIKALCSAKGPEIGSRSPRSIDILK